MLRSLNYSSTLSRFICIVGIAIGLLYLIRLYEDTFNVREPYFPEAGIALFLTLSFLLILIISFFKSFIMMLVCIIVSIIDSILFLDWAVRSYRVIHDAQIGWLGKVNKFGLVGAEWEHIIMLLITVYLAFVGILEILRFLRKNALYRTKIKSELWP